MNGELFLLKFLRFYQYITQVDKDHDRNDE